MIQIPLKAGHRRPSSETPFAGVPMMAQHLMLTDFSGDPADHYR